MPSISSMLALVLTMSGPTVLPARPPSVAPLTGSRSLAPDTTTPKKPTQTGNRQSAPHTFLDTTAPAAHPRMRDIRSGFAHIGYLDSVAAPPGATDTTPLRVLFIGNSLTYFHEMPRIFMALAAQGLRRPVVVGLVSLPGMPIQLISMMTDVDDVVKRFPWSYVVLQQKPQPSPFGGLSVSGGDMPMSSWTVQDNQQIIKHYVQLSAPAKVLVWNQYYMPGSGRRGERFVDSLIGGAARAEGVPHVQVSAAWNQVAGMDSATWYHLYQEYLPDTPEETRNTHPSASGSYLIAMMVYQAITGNSAAGLPSTLDRVHFLEPNGPLSIPPATATLLQRAAVAASKAATESPKP